MLWIVRTGSPWRDPPAMFGNWSTAYTRFRDWVKANGWIDAAHLHKLGERLRKSSYGAYLRRLAEEGEPGPI